MLKFFAGITALALTLIATPVTSQEGTFKCEDDRSDLYADKDLFQAVLVRNETCKGYETEDLRTFYDCDVEANFSVRRLDIRVRPCRAWRAARFNCIETNAEKNVCVRYKCTIEKSIHDKILAEGLDEIYCH